MTKFNQDYKITISGDLNGNVYWGLLRKGEPAVCNEDEIRMVAQVLGELKEKIKAHVDQQPIDFDDVDPNHLVHQHEDKEGEK